MTADYVMNLVSKLIENIDGQEKEEFKLKATLALYNCYG